MRFVGQAMPARSSITMNQSQSKGAALVLPGFLFSSRPYTPLVSLLRQEGYAAEVVPMSNQDWLPVLFLGGSFEFYLQRLDTVLQQMYEQHGPVALIGHSAGGWIARLLLGEVPYQGVTYARYPMVHSLITLGTPHASIEAYPFGRVPEKLNVPLDTPPAIATSSLQYTNHFLPTAQSLKGVNMVCVAGNSIRGRPFNEAFNRKNLISNRDGTSNTEDQSGSGWDAYLAYEGYKSGCGRGDVDGDGVTPICIAHLQGATNVVLEGAWHSPRSNPAQKWYGDAEIFAQWEQHLTMADSFTVNAGEEVMISPKVTDEEAKEKFPNHRVIQVKSGKAYIRKTMAPEA